MKTLEEALREQRGTGHFTVTISLNVEELNELTFGDSSMEVHVLSQFEEEVEITAAVDIVEIVGVTDGRVQLRVRSTLMVDDNADINDDNADINDDNADINDAGDGTNDAGDADDPASRCTCSMVVANDQRRPHLASHGLTVDAMTDDQIDACFTT